MLKVLKGIVLWMLAIGMALMIETIAISDALEQYMGIREDDAYLFVGCFVVTTAYVLWYMRKNENKWIDIALPVSVLVLWGIVRHHQLYLGLNGALCSIAEAIKNAYGFASDITLAQDITAACLRETILFVTAVVMFFIIFLIERCGSMCLAVGFSTLFVVAAATVNLEPNAASLVLTVSSLLSLRYIMVRKGRTTGAVTGVIIPVVFLGLCMLFAGWLQKPVFDAGMKGQDKLVEAANRIVNLSDDKSDYKTGKKQIAQYDTINGEKVELSDHVVKSLSLPEKPESTYYYAEQVYNTYTDGTWSYHEATYALAPDVYTRFPEYGLNMLYDDIAMLDFNMDDTMDTNAALAARIRVITEFIQEHATYTTDPGGFEEEADPIICFLYDKHKGYCVHFASAAALSLRASGVPSRYVTGYAIPPSAWEMNESGGYTADILENYGHAWAEAYNQETDTWMIAEATPGYLGDGISDIPFETDWNNTLKDDTSETEPDEAGATENASDEDEITDKEDAVDGEADSKDLSETLSGEENASDHKADNQYADASDDKTDRQREAKKIPTLAILAVSVLLLIVLCLLGLCIRRRIIVIRRSRYFRSRDRRNAIYRMSEAIYDMLDFACMVDKGIGDDMEYAAQIDEKLDFLKEGEFVLFSEQVQAAVYGAAVPEIDDMTRYLKMYRLIRMHLYWRLSVKNRFVWKFMKCYD